MSCKWCGIIKSRNFKLHSKVTMIMEPSVASEIKCLHFQDFTNIEVIIFISYVKLSACAVKTANVEVIKV